MVVFPSPLVILFFAVFIIMWGQAMIDMWDCFEKDLCCCWGMIKYEMKEVTRF